MGEIGELGVLWEIECGNMFDGLDDGDIGTIVIVRFAYDAHTFRMTLVSDIDEGIAVFEKAMCLDMHLVDQGTRRVDQDAVFFFCNLVVFWR